MACLLVPAAEAVITTIVTKVIKSKEMKVAKPEGLEEAGKIKFSTKLGWLNKMLWGSSALLAFEHVWHGEIIPTFPFLTAVKTGETLEMLKEMGSVGVSMAILCTVIWAGIVAVTSVMEKKATESKGINLA